MLKRLGIVSHQVVGVPDVQGWSQVQVVVPFDQNELMRRGSLVLVMSLVGISDEVATKGGQLLEHLVREFEKGRQAPLEWLKQNLAWFKEQVGTGGHLVALIIIPDKTGLRRALYVGGWGEVLVQLERGDQKSTILSGGNIQTLSGWLQSEDIIGSGTAHFMERIWMNLGGELESRIEEAQSRVGGLDLAGLMAGVALKVNALPQEEPDQLAVPARPIPVVEVVPENVPIPEPVPPVQKNLKNWMTQNAWLRRIRERNLNLHLRGGQDQRPIKRVSLIAGGLFLLLLLVSVGVGGIQRRRSVEQQKFDAVVQPLQHSLQEAQALQTVNPVRARSLVMEVGQNAASQGDRFAKTRFNTDWKKFLDQIASVWQAVAGEKPVEGKLWLDLGIVRDGTKVSDLKILSNKKLVILDKNAGVVMAVNLLDKNSWVAGGGADLSGSMVLGGLVDKGVVLTDKGITQVDVTNKTSKGLLTKATEKWEDPHGVFGFGPNLYVLDRQDIWKYPGLDGSLGKRTRWLKPGVQPDLSGTTDWFIDGQVWILQSGRLIQYDQGKPTNFSLKNGDPDPTYTRLGLGARRSEIYLLDPKAAKIVVFDRNSGEYKQQLVWNGLSGATSLVVDEDRGRLIVGKDSSLFEIKL